MCQPRQVADTGSSGRSLVRYHEPIARIVSIESEQFGVPTLFFALPMSSSSLANPGSTPPGAQNEELPDRILGSRYVVGGCQ